MAAMLDDATLSALRSVDAEDFLRERIEAHLLIDAMMRERDCSPSEAILFLLGSGRRGVNRTVLEGIAEDVVRGAAGQLKERFGNWWGLQAASGAGE